MEHTLKPVELTLNIFYVISISAKVLDLGGIADSGFARRQPFSAITCGLSFIYATANNDKRKEIEAFIEKYYFLREMTIDLLLLFETSKKEVNGVIMDISFKNGKEAVDSMIKDFRNVVKK